MYFVSKGRSNCAHSVFLHNAWEYCLYTGIRQYEKIKKKKEICGQIAPASSVSNGRLNILFDHIKYDQLYIPNDRVKYRRFYFVASFICEY